MCVVLTGREYEGTFWGTENVDPGGGHIGIYLSENSSSSHLRLLKKEYIYIFIIYNIYIIYNNIQIYIIYNMYIFIYLLAVLGLCCSTQGSLQRVGSSLWCVGFSLVVACRLQSVWAL